MINGYDVRLIRFILLVLLRWNNLVDGVDDLIHVKLFYNVHFRLYMLWYIIFYLLFLIDLESDKFYLIL